jgi:DNA-binding NarL/FixJ family response regulator
MEADLAVLDLSLGARQCADAVREVKETRPDLKVLVMSIHDEPGAVRKAVSAGAEGFVPKRTAAEQLIPAVNEILSGGTYFSVIQKR